jgi:hypothetical protein
MFTRMGSLPSCQQTLVHVLPHVVRPGGGGEGHVADARDSLGEHALEVVAVDGQELPARYLREHPCGVDHARRLAEHAGETPVGVAVEDASRRRLRILRDAQGAEAGGVEPEGVEVAGAHRDRPLGERGVQRVAGGGHGGVPESRAPALGDEPAVAGMREREGTEPLHAVRLACAGIAVRERRGEERRVKHVLVGVVKAGGDERITIVVVRVRRRPITCAPGDDLPYPVSLNHDVSRNVGVVDVEVDVLGADNGTCHLRLPSMIGCVPPL